MRLVLKKETCSRGWQLTRRAKNVDISIIAQNYSSIGASKSRFSTMIDQEKKLRIFSKTSKTWVKLTHVKAFEKGKRRMRIFFSTYFSALHVGKIVVFNTEIQNLFQLKKKLKTSLICPNRFLKPLPLFLKTP